MAAAIPYALLAASAALQYRNTTQTAKRQDAEAAAGIRQQSKKQGEADAKVAEEVQRLAASTAEDERARGLGSFMDTLRRTSGAAGSGLGGPGGEAFQQAAGEALTGVSDYGRGNADLLSRIDAAQQQRQGEAFGYGRLGTDLGLIGRESAGDAFINQLRLQGIRRNAGMDLAAGLLASGAGSMGGGATGANTLGASRGSLSKSNTGFKNYGGGP